MDTTYTGRAAPTFRRAGSLIAAALVLLAVLAAILLAGSRGQRLAPYGPALGGLVAREEGGDIVIVDPANGRRTTVTTGPDWDAFPGFSPDGRKLVFVRSTGPVSRFGALMVANADGTDVYAVTEPILNITSGDWSGDSAYIAITSSNTATSDADDQMITVVDVKQGTSHALNLGMSVETVSWIPPLGQELLFRGLKADQPEAIWAVHPDGTGLRALTPLRADLGEDYVAPMVSPDGRFLAYHTWNFTTTTMDAVVLDLREGTSLPMPNSQARSDLFVTAFSPDSGSLLLVRQIRDSDPPEFGGARQLMLVPFDEAAGTIMLGPIFKFPSVEKRADLQAAFTVDGSKVVLLDRQHLLDPEQHQLWTLPVDGSPGRVGPWESNNLPSTQRVLGLGTAGQPPVR